jgi:hypothetical protein
MFDLSKDDRHLQSVMLNVIMQHTTLNNVCLEKNV